jgi:hypothetical protein
VRARAADHERTGASARVVVGDGPVPPAFRLRVSAGRAALRPPLAAVRRGDATSAGATRRGGSTRTGAGGSARLLAAATSGSTPDSAACVPGGARRRGVDLAGGSAAPGPRGPDCGEGCRTPGAGDRQGVSAAFDAAGLPGLGGLRVLRGPTRCPWDGTARHAITGRAGSGGAFGQLRGSSASWTPQAPPAGALSTLTAPPSPRRARPVRT